mmetsp:Transcript_24649/g.79338  ORF Transcript_24649/g.79338 Transcript_24649/m.79338 type:complete len:850 (+) Transcript_24649:63-2612(+)
MTKRAILTLFAAVCAIVGASKLDAQYETKHVALIIPEVSRQILQRISAVIVRVDFDQPLQFNGTVIANTTMRTMKALGVITHFSCPESLSFELKPAVRPADQEWSLVPLPSFQPELRLFWQASALAQEPQTQPSVLAALVHPTDPTRGQALPPLSTCSLRFAEGISFVDGTPLPQEAPLRAFVPTQDEYLRVDAPRASSLHAAAAGFVSSEAWHATLLAAGSQARPWEPFHAVRREEDVIDDQGTTLREAIRASAELKRRQHAVAQQKEVEDVPDMSSSALPTVAGVGEGEDGQVQVDMLPDAAAMAPRLGRASAAAARRLLMRVEPSEEQALLADSPPAFVEEQVQSQREQRRASRASSEASAGEEETRFVVSSEPLDAAVFADADDSSSVLRTAPELLGEDPAEVASRERGEGGHGDQLSRGLFDVIPRASEVRSAEDVVQEHVFLQTGPIAKQLDAFFITYRDASHAASLSELKYSGDPQERPAHVAVKAARAVRGRELSLSFLEASSKVSALLQVGVKSRETFAMIVDQIINHAPEMITAIIASTAAGPVVNMVGKALSCVLPPLLVPSSGSVPCLAPGGDGQPMPSVVLPAPPCSCNKGGLSLPVFAELSKSGLHQQSGAECACSDSGEAPHALLQTEDQARALADSNEQVREMMKSLLDAQAEAKARDSKGGPVDNALPKIKEEVNNAIMSMSLPAVAGAASGELSESLPVKVRERTLRRTAMMLTQTLVERITTMAVAHLANRLSRDLTFTTSRALTRGLVPALTHSLAPSIALALTHQPKSDVYCYHCHKEKLWCQQCALSRQTDYMQMYYANYYASFYSSYYTERYVSIGDMFSTLATAG